jgi:hypothetical protein
VAGYSGTPLIAKLGLEPGFRVLTLGAPRDYRTWLGAGAAALSFVAKPQKSDCEAAHLFVTSLADLDRALPVARKAIRNDGMIWVSWPKKASKIATDVSEDAVRSRALKTDLVDVKVCAVSEVWSGLKLVVRKHLR